MSKAAFVITEWPSHQMHQFQLKSPDSQYISLGGPSVMLPFLSPLPSPSSNPGKSPFSIPLGLQPSPLSTAHVQMIFSSQLTSAMAPPHPVHSQLFNQCNLTHLILASSCLKLAPPTGLRVSLMEEPGYGALHCSLVPAAPLGSCLAGHTGLHSTLLVFPGSSLPQSLYTCDSSAQEHLPNPLSSLCLFAL